MIKFKYKKEKLNDIFIKLNKNIEILSENEKNISLHV